MALPTRHLVLTARIALMAVGLMSPRRLRSWTWRALELLWLYPTLTRNCQWHGPVVTRFETDRREVWLTIDDGPDPEDTPDLLDLLREHDAHATFFVIGRKVEQCRPLIRRVLEEGHSLGNHTYSHRAAFWWAMPRPLVRREITLCDETLLVASGQKPRWFRSPVGMNNASIHPAAQATGHRVIGWSAAGGDGCPAAPCEIVSRIMKEVTPGAIILIHEGGCSRRRAVTLARLLEALSAEGYRCVLPEESALH
jgi:peptidoglycan-N-acetylglucosamine deacetylase